MNLKATALRAVQFIVEGRELADAAITSLGDPEHEHEASLELQHELSRALQAIDTGRNALHAVMILLSTAHPSLMLPSERAR